MPAAALPRLADSDAQAAAARRLRDLLDEAITCYVDADHQGAYQLLVEVRAAVEQGVPCAGRDADRALRYLARTLLDLGEPDHAHTLLAGHVADLECRHGFADLETALAAVALADALRHVGTVDHLDAAERLYRRVIGLSVTDRGESWWAVLTAEAGLALTDAVRGQRRGALHRLTRVVRRIGDSYGLDHHDALRLVEDLAVLHVAVGETRQARDLLAAVLPIAAGTFGDAHALTRRLARRSTVLHHSPHPSTTDVTAPAPAVGGAAGPQPRTVRRWALVALLITAAAVVAAIVAVAGLRGGGVPR